MKCRRVALIIGLCWLLTSLCYAQDTPDSGNSAAADPLRVLDISERTYDNGPAVAIVLSKPLDPTVRHDEHIRISSTREMLKSAWVLSDDGRTLYFPHVEPETEYAVTVLESLTAADGAALASRTSSTVTTRAVTPIISFASEGFLLPTDLTRGLPVVTVNVPSVYVEFFRMNEQGLVQYVNWRNTTGQQSYYELSRSDRFGEMIYSGRFDLKAPPNRRTVNHIPVEEIDALQEPGVYLAVMRRPGEYDYQYHATYFLVTDMALHARVYDHASLIFASSLRTGKPVSGVLLNFYNQKGNRIDRGETDAEGTLRYPKPLPGDVHLITAVHEGQVGVLPVRIPALDMSEFDLGKRPYRPREVFVYSPRDLYRPGETVVLSALLRDDDGSLVESLPLSAKLFRPDGREIKNFTWHPEEMAQELNYYQTTLDLPRDAQTGLWQLKLWDDPAASQPVNTFPFHVEEFLPERMKLDLSVEPEHPGPATPLQVMVSGEYLYGAPASGNEIAARVRAKAEREVFDAYKGFLFGSVQDASYQEYWELEKQQLDETGEAALEIPAKWEAIRSPVSVRVAVELCETGGRPVTRAVSQTVLPGDTLLGIRPMFQEETAESGLVRFEVVRTGKDGTPAPTADEIVVELTKEDRDYYWEYSDATGWQHKYNQKEYQYLAESIRLQEGGPTPYTVHLPDGQYVLAMTDPASGLVTSVRFRVGSWWSGQDQGDAARPDKVVLTLDQPAYRSGDIVRLTVTPPHPGEALILVEGQSPLWMKRLPVSGEGTEVEIPILAGWDSHNLYISVVIFRPADAEEKITPNRAVGLIHLPLDRSHRRLDVQIDAPEKARAESPLTVNLRLSSDDPAGIPEHAYVTLAAVDVGILSITDFETPDPFDYFFSRRRFDVNSYDVYSRVIEMLDGPVAAIRYGGDADLKAGKLPESDVKLLSLFTGPVAFDETGQARITLDMPHFNGRVRLMAVAFSTTAFGSAEKEVTVTAPLVTQLAMPRFLAPGDESLVTLDIHNRSGMAQAIRLTLAAEGTIRLRQGERAVELADGEKTTLRFPVTAEADFGPGTLTLQLDGDDIRIDRQWTLGVRPGYPAISRKVFEVLTAGETFTLDDRLIADLIPDTVDADLKISSRLPLNFQNAMKGLITFPYGCLEQTSSRAYPLLHATPDQIARFSLPPITPEERIKRLNQAIERLASLQLASGGFGLWNRNSPESPWLTAYVTDFLLTARDMGLSIPDTLLEKSLTRMEEYLNRGAPQPDYMDNELRDSYAFAVRSYAAYVLARLNRAPLGTLRPLYDNHRDDAISSLPLTHLGIALKRMGDMKRSQEALTAAAETRRKEETYWGDYGSPLRDLALTVALLVENEAENVDGFDTLLRDLGDAVRSRKWLSTQEKYAIFRAGIALNRQTGESWQARLTVDGEDRQIDHQGDFLVSLNAGEIAGGVTVAPAAERRLYVSSVVNGYTQEPPPPQSEQIDISRELYDTQGNRVERNIFQVGELLLVHLTISAKQQIPDGLVVDMLPAGFEAENQNLKHTASMADLALEGEPVWRLKEQASILHEEYRDDRYVAAVRLYDHQLTHLFYLVRVVTPGTFSVPPPFVESMYRPEIRGIGETPAPMQVENRGNSGE